MSVVCCLVEVSATGWSLFQRSATECCVSECDRETACTSVVYVYGSCTTCLSIRLDYNSRFLGLGCWAVSGNEQKKKISCKAVDDNGNGLKTTGAS